MHCGAELRSQTACKSPPQAEWCPPCRGAPLRCKAAPPRCTAPATPAPRRPAAAWARRRAGRRPPCLPAQPRGGLAGAQRRSAPPQTPCPGGGHWGYAAENAALCGGLAMPSSSLDASVMGSGRQHRMASRPERWLLAHSMWAWPSCLQRRVRQCPPVRVGHAEAGHAVGARPVLALHVPWVAGGSVRARFVGRLRRFGGRVWRTMGCRGRGETGRGGCIGPQRCLGPFGSVRCPPASTPGPACHLNMEALCGTSMVVIAADCRQNTLEPWRGRGAAAGGLGGWIAGLMAKPCQPGGTGRVELRHAVSRRAKPPGVSPGRPAPPRARAFLWGGSGGACTRRPLKHPLRRPP